MNFKNFVARFVRKLKVTCARFVDRAIDIAARDAEWRGAGSGPAWRQAGPTTIA
jgi:hypothetical protein